MPKTKVGKKHRPLPPPRGAREFEIEGDLWIRYTSGGPLFVVDDCHLSEFVRRHFRPVETDDGYRIGRCKVLIIPVNE